jgi:hypothetical protein
MIGFASFAGFLMILAGIFQVIQGFAAILNGDFFVAGPRYIFSFDVTTWGWIHLLLGIVIGLAGASVFSGQAWARGVGIFFAILSAIANFFYIPYYPFWAILIITIDVVIIWALAGYGPNEAEV